MDPRDVYLLRVLFNNLTRRYNPVECAERLFVVLGHPQPVFWIGREDNLYRAKVSTDLFETDWFVSSTLAVAKNMAASELINVAERHYGGLPFDVAWQRW